MKRSPWPYIFSALTVALVAGITAALLPVLGLASAALLFLLPVLFSSSRGGIGPGLFAALTGAASYNYLLLPPRFTLRIHGFDNIVSVIVLVAVALVTSRLATRLQARRAEADARARASEEAAELAAVLAKSEGEAALAAGAQWLEQRFGAVRLLGNEDVGPNDPGLTPLDLSAAAWALHNADMTGHGTAIMPAADWTYCPLAPHNRGEGRVIAVARPLNGSLREDGELAQLRQLAFLLGQAWDRAELSRERRERERLQDSEKLRRGLLASLAHDFRTPLTVIAGHLEELSTKAPEAIEALDAARRLNRMMEDLLGAARLEGGQVSPALESIDLVDSVGAACATAHFPSSLTVRRSLSGDLPFVLADPMLLHHVLLNLLDNAAHHAEREIVIQADTEGALVRLSVSDDGSGIPPDDRDRIFNRFVRLEGSDRTHGSGLGLSIVKGFADAMRIGLDVSSSSSGGACFTLSLPRSGVAQS
jgi:two-component system sensor histidine kinase KdpD